MKYYLNVIYVCREFKCNCPARRNLSYFYLKPGLDINIRQIEHQAQLGTMNLPPPPQKKRNAFKKYMYSKYK
jgi:hypothetical protein